jgi:selenocysteine lyase/cysteine desulfurase
MNRKEFLKGLAAVVGSLAGPSAARAGGFRAVLQDASAASDAAFWKLIRDEFVLDPGWSYLNFGGLGTCPMPVLNSFWEWTRTEERAPSAGHDEKVWWDVKERLARLLGPSCRKEDLALISCATEGLNAIINGLPLKKGDEVITSTHEHVAVNVGLLNRMQRDGIVIRLFEPDLARAQGNVERISGLVNPRTRLILISHVTCTTGQLFPAPEIAALARSRNIWFALDGAQAPVCVPFDIVETGADFYTSSTHKWLMGPKRTGFLYVRQGMLDTLRPVTTGAYSSERNDITKLDLALHPTAQRYEYGTQNDALFFALGAAIDFVQTIGLPRIWAHNHALAEKFYKGLQGIAGAEILSPQEEAYRTAMISFRMKDRTYSQVNEQLAKAKIRVRPVTEGGLNCIRVSFHICNHDPEVDAILGALRSLA